jgi:hypothetical protein
MSLLMSFAAAVAAIASSSAGGLTEALQAEGYTAVRLRPSTTGHLHTSGFLQGRSVEVLVDTGASNTVIDIELAKALGLTLTAVEQRGVGVGLASVSVSRVTGASFSVGGIPIEGDVFAMDLSGVRKALAARGVAGFHAVLGGDTMRKLDAILLYGENALFLRPEKH